MTSKYAKVDGFGLPNSFGLEIVSVFETVSSCLKVSRFQKIVWDQVSAYSPIHTLFLSWCYLIIDVCAYCMVECQFVCSLSYKVH